MYTREINVIFCSIAIAMFISHVKREAMVVTAKAIASKIGINILHNGGNAIDAAVAIGYVLAVIQPYCGNIGGGGFMTIHLSDGRDLFLNFREKAPLRSHRDMFVDPDTGIIKDNINSFKAIAIPGTVMGLNEALSKYGTMTLREVMAPAIKLAIGGYRIDETDATIFRNFGSKLDPIAWRLFSSSGLPKEGDHVTQPLLANTLAGIAKYGHRYFYEGPIAKAIITASEQSGGILSLRDFETYDIEWLPPISSPFNDYTIISSPPPSTGGITLCQMLNIISQYPSPIDTRIIIEIMRYAHSHRKEIGDPNFFKNPIERLLSQGHAEEMCSKIARDEESINYGIDGEEEGGGNTTHYSVLDRWGNAVSVTYTINSLFGSGISAPGTGFLLNSQMDDFTAKIGEANQYGLFQGRRNTISPGKRPLSSMTPTIIKYKGDVIMVIGSPGGATITTSVFQVIMNILIYGMNVKDAVDAPRIHHQWLPDIVYMEEGGLNPDEIARLEEMGYTIKIREPWGAVETIFVSSDGEVIGANDRRRPEGLAISNSQLSRVN